MLDFLLQILINALTFINAFDCLDMCGSFLYVYFCLNMFVNCYFVMTNSLLNYLYNTIILFKYKFLYYYT